MASDAAPSKTMTALEPNLGKEMITIYVGEKRKEFTIHKNLLQKSSFFKTLQLNPRGKEKDMYMPEDSPGAFSLFVDWIYRSRITTGNTEQHLHNLYDLYILAEKLELDDLKDKTMDVIQDMALEYDLKDQLITHTLRDKVLTQTPSKMVGLRWFCLLFMAYVFLCRAEVDPDEDDAVEDDADEYSDSNEPIEPRQEGDEKTLYIKQDDLKTVWKIGKIDWAFYRAFQNHLSLLLQVKWSRISDDPRIRYEENPEDRCWFHCHESGFDCRAEERKKEGLKFVTISEQA